MNEIKQLLELKNNNKKICYKTGPYFVKLEELGIRVNYSDIHHIIPYSYLILYIFCRHCEATFSVVLL